MTCVTTSGRRWASPVGGAVSVASGMTGYWIIALTAVASTLVLAHVLDDDSFRRFYGPLPPVVVVVVAALAGAVSLRRLATRRWLPTRRHRASHLFRSGVTGIAFAAIALAVDAWWIHFPRDMNVAWPHSLLFYPAIGFVAEVVFHLAPLALVVTVQRSRAASDGGVAVAIAVVAGVEALFHTLDALTGPEPWLALFVAPQLAAVGICQLVLLRRYGFAAMYAFRLGYYLLWHVVWGYARLSLLF